MRTALGLTDAAVVFGRLMHHMAMAVKPIIGMVPPDPTSLSPGDLAGLLKLGGHFRSLGPERFHALQMSAKLNPKATRRSLGHEDRVRLGLTGNR